MLEQLMINPIIWATTSIIGIAGFIFAIVTHFKNKRKKGLSYIIDSKTLIQNKKCNFEKLSIKYDDIDISNMTISNVTIWNSGNTVINSNDIVKGYELTIKVPDDICILDVTTLLENDETNKFVVTRTDEKTIQIMFDYVGINDGVVIQVIHTGNKKSISVTCVIKDGDAPKNLDKTTSKFGSSFLKAWHLSKKGEIIYMLIFTGLMCVVWFFLLLISILIENKIIINDKIKEVVSINCSSYIPIWFGVVIQIIFVVMFILTIKISVREFKMNIPSNLRYKEQNDG